MALESYFAAHRRFLTIVTTRNPLLFPVYIPSLLLSFCQGMLIPVLPLFAKSFDVSYGLIGLVLAAEGIGRLAGDLPAGILLNRTGRNASMVCGIVVVIFSVSCLYGAESILEIVLLRFVAGLGNAFWDVSRYAYIAELTPIYQRGRAIAVYGGVNRIGSFLGPAVGAFLSPCPSRPSWLLRSPWAWVMGSAPEA